MQFNERWLREFVDPQLTSEQLAHQLTMAGLEVEALEAVAADFSGIVVGHVLEVAPHPNADRLRVCRVDAGEAAPLQIVCGAPNVAAGMKVPCAKVGAALPGLEIKAAKLRGVESFGMLCSARELGLSEDASGLLALPDDAPVGSDVRALLALDDRRYTIKLTPNRADCLGVTGIAREVAALTGAPLTLPAATVNPVTSDARVAVTVADADLCGRFSGRVIRGVNARAATPAWMRQRLERCGQRSISALVDISNYVMLESNRPNHVFDADKIAGGITVRWARESERLTLLNGQTVTLGADIGVVADEAGVESLAGIMGGESTSCTLDTTNVYVEAAFWWPDAIQGRSRRYGFTSEAGHRFERGVDYAGTVDGVERVTELILQICGGEAGPIDDHVTTLPQRKPIRLRPARAARILGIALPAEEIASLYTRLGLQFDRDGGDFIVTPPSYRFDLEIEEDLVEELARLHGYDNIPMVEPRAGLPMLPVPESRRELGRVKRILVDRDYQEVINFAFIERQWEQDLCGNGDPVVLANPIASQMAVMRSSLIPGLVANVATNRKRQLDRVRVFEVGCCFQRAAGGTPVPGFHQPMRIAALAWGGVQPEQWGTPARAADFFDVKGDLEALLAPRRLVFRATSHPALHPGRCAEVECDGQRLGVLGELHPQWVQQYELGRAPVLFELDLEPLLATELPRYAEVSRLPSVRRDIALVVPHAVRTADLLACLQQAAPAVVKELAPFDLYQGKGLAEGEKSIAFRIVMQDTARTLEDRDTDAAVAALVAAAQEKFGARLRG